MVFVQQSCCSSLLGFVLMKLPVNSLRNASEMLLRLGGGDGWRLNKARGRSDDLV